MSICKRYVRTESEAIIVLNDAFLKVFQKKNINLNTFLNLGLE